MSGSAVQPAADDRHPGSTDGDLYIRIGAVWASALPRARAYAICKRNLDSDSLAALSARQVIVEGILINILNPKLSIEVARIARLVRACLRQP
jgi:hypothetical protein